MSAKSPGEALRVNWKASLKPRPEKAAMKYDKVAVPLNEADGIPWADVTTRDLRAALAHGDSINEIVDYLQFSEETVRTKMKELGLFSQAPGAKR